MPLTKQQIIEIQAAAKYNTLKLMREAEEQKQFKVDVAEKIAEAKKPEAVQAEVKAKASVKTAKKGKK